eukprot:scaffold5933_cov41-Cyclotella_meneghiniana.AAC.2
MSACRHADKTHRPNDGTRAGRYSTRDGERCNGLSNPRPNSPSQVLYRENPRYKRDCYVCNVTRER